jgi:hypothetical protein
MGSHVRGLIRLQLSIQVLPEAVQDLLTLHSFSPLQGSHDGGYSHQNRPATNLVPGSARPGVPEPAGGNVTARGRLVTLVALLAFAALLLWSTLSSQHVECTVTVAFRGARQSGTASAASQPDALREAQTAACGPLTQGMNDRIACDRTPPLSRRCRNL